MLDGGANIAVSDLGFRSLPGFAPDSINYAGRAMGLFARAVQGLRVEAVHALQYNHAGVYLTSTGAGAGQVYSRDVTVKGCRLERNRVAGLAIGNAQRVLAERNQFIANGRLGDGSTGYGMAGLSAEAPRQVVVCANAAAYNVRKGIDFHAGFDMEIHHNNVVGNGLVGIFTGALDADMGGVINIHHNHIYDMNPRIAQGTHLLDSIRYPQGAGTDINAVYGIYIGLHKFKSPTPEVRIVSNRITAFDGANPPNGVAQRYFPLAKRAYADTNVAYTITGKTIDVGYVWRIAGSNRVAEPTPAQGKQTLKMSGNPITYTSIGGPLFEVSRLRTAAFTRNRFTRRGAATGTDAWDD